MSSSLPAKAPSTPPPRFAAFTHRNFRIFWAGNLVSNVGSLAQQAAMGWLTRTLTDDARFVTFVAACSTLPILFFSLHAGAIADRVEKRSALQLFNLLAGVGALVLGALVYLDWIQLWHVIVFALAMGVIGAFDIPIRQSFNVEMVGREDLPSAIALNSTAFNTARVLGPAVGGFLIHALSIAGCFWANTLSYAAIIFALKLMRLEAREKTEAARVPLRGAALWRGVLFVKSHQTLRPVVMLVAVVSFFAMSFGALLPIFARDVFDTDARGFTMLLTYNGVGALAAAMSLAYARKMHHKGKRLLLGAFGFCLSTLAFALMPTLFTACLTLVLSGFALLTFLMTANTLVQTLSPDHLRGRVFALYSMALIGTTPLGSIALGFAANSIGPRVSVAAGCAIAALWVIGVFSKCRSLWKQK